MEQIRELQAYGYLVLVVFLTIVLYAYIHHLYKTQRSGEKDYEKYSDLALNDDISSSPIEEYTKDEKGRSK
ncbi:MAG: cytochrome c oxidase, cbb3-type, CcoQ subunit [Epsilonproteobacteria bacterium]|nr:cytochrome c oxidase, cbb3-type, CcoQ subunit [Campylobacterota bacterium]